MIFSDACGIVFASTAGAVTRARWAGDGPGFPRTWARAAPRRLEPRRAALGLEEMSCKMLDKRSSDVSTGTLTSSRDLSIIIEIGIVMEGRRA